MHPIHKATLDKLIKEAPHFEDIYRRAYGMMGESVTVVGWEEDTVDLIDPDLLNKEGTAISFESDGAIVVKFPDSEDFHKFYGQEVVMTSDLNVIENLTTINSFGKGDRNE